MENLNHQDKCCPLAPSLCQRIHTLLQSVDYYLAPFRISKPTYVWHLLDIIRAPIGRPLLLQLAATPEKIADLLTAEPEQPVQVSIRPPLSFMILSSLDCLLSCAWRLCLLFAWSWS